MADFGELSFATVERFAFDTEAVDVDFGEQEFALVERIALLGATAGGLPPGLLSSGEVIRAV